MTKFSKNEVKTKQAVAKAIIRCTKTKVKREVSCNKPGYQGRFELVQGW